MQKQEKTDQGADKTREDVFISPKRDNVLSGKPAHEKRMLQLPWISLDEARPISSLKYFVDTRPIPTSENDFLRISAFPTARATKDKLQAPP
mmetsp:Transcript_1295/g.3734  ORF Transcript_1295/g.3734 Transcript_1295/m.3734 type:complete len:92 (-) Transcript_1295:861-1136(-)